MAQDLSGGSTLESSGTGVWAGRPRPWYRTSSLSGPFRGPAAVASPQDRLLNGLQGGFENCRWSPVAFFLPGAALGRASFSFTRHVARSLSAPGICEPLWFPLLFLLPMFTGRVDA